MRLIIPIIFLILLAACASFINKSEITQLKEKEGFTYILKKDIDIEGTKLKKGDEIKIIIATGKEWVKVYAHPVRTDPLKTGRYLILYSFDDEYFNKTFNVDQFNEKLEVVVGLKGHTATPEKKIREKIK